MFRYSGSGKNRKKIAEITNLFHPIEALSCKQNMITKFAATMRGYHNPKRDMGKSYDQFWIEFIGYFHRKKQFELIKFIDENEGSCVYILVHSFRRTLHL